MTQTSYQKHLFVVHDDAGTREYVLDGPIYAIGRHPKCDIQIFSQFISRRHATLMQFPDEDGALCYHMIDGNIKGTPSANGLRINGTKQQTHILQHGDEIDFGAKVRATYYLICEAATADKTDLTDQIQTTAVNLQRLAECLPLV